MRYVLFGLLILASGCVKAPIEGRADPFRIKQIYFADADLANRTAVSEPILERRNGIMFVTVPIRSANNLSLRVDYRYTFVNAQGSPIYTSGWEAGPTLVGNTLSYVTFNSTSADAADFKLDIRYSQ